MTINGIDTLLTYNAKQHKVNFGFREISNSSEWINSASLPHFSRNRPAWKTISVEMIVKGDGRGEIRGNISRLLGDILEENDIVLDNVPHTFRAVLDRYDVQEESIERFHKLTLTFKGYEYGDETFWSGTDELKIDNPGTALSPIIVELMPLASLTNVILTGICKSSLTGEDLPVTIGATATGKKIILDGANGLFTENSVLKPDVSIQELPAVTPGKTEITCSSSQIHMKVTVLPIYM